MSGKKEKTYPAYVSNYKSSQEKQVVLLMIPNEEGRESPKDDDDGIIL